MLRSLNSGVSAMQQFQQKMDVIGNNIANVDTTGYKSARVDFEDTFSQTLRGAGTQGSMQIGTGVTTSAITNQFVQGAINTTGTTTDLAISGNGFFIVQDPNTTAQYVTRAGNFHRDLTNNLVTSSGMQVVGYPDGTLGGAAGPINLLTSRPSTTTADISTVSIDANGTINVTLTDGTPYVAGQVLLQTFINPGALVKEGSNLYSGMSNAGALAAPLAPQTIGLGKIVSGALESSNVDLANEFASMIVTQRAFQASARIITTSDEILQELVNLKR